MTEKVTLDDVEAKLREISGSTTQAVGAAKAPVLGGAAVAGAVLLAVIYLLGRRRGRKESPILEIRRI